MAPHLAQEELDWIQKRRKPGLSPSALHKLFVKFREGKGITAPHITQFRKVLTPATAPAPAQADRAGLCWKLLRARGRTTA